jgi:hypothetical protein
VIQNTDVVALPKPWFKNHGEKWLSTPEACLRNFGKRAKRTGVHLPHRDAAVDRTGAGQTVLYSLRSSPNYWNTLLLTKSRGQRAWLVSQWLVNQGLAHPNHDDIRHDPRRVDRGE